jgi:hypothetical protein
VGHGADILQLIRHRKVLIRWIHTKDRRVAKPMQIRGQPPHSGRARQGAGMAANNA